MINFIDRTVLSEGQKMEAAKQILEVVNYYGLNREIFTKTEAFKKSVAVSKDIFDLTKNIPASLVAIEREIKEAVEKLEKEIAKLQAEELEKRKAPTNMTIMQIAIKDAENMTVGEYLDAVVSRYKEAGLTEVVINKIISEEADDTLTVSMVNNPNLISSTFQNEPFEAIKAYNAFMCEEEYEEEEECECSNEDLFIHVKTKELYEVLDYNVINTSTTLIGEERMYAYVCLSRENDKTLFVKSEKDFLKHFMKISF
ncbi:MAG: hypothetical protein ACRCX2_13245 [Paraclostridium sp.]